MESINS